MKVKNCSNFPNKRIAGGVIVEVSTTISMIIMIMKFQGFNFYLYRYNNLAIISAQILYKVLLVIMSA